VVAVIDIGVAASLPPTAKAADAKPRSAEILTRAIISQVPFLVYQTIERDCDDPRDHIRDCRRGKADEPERIDDARHRPIIARFASAIGAMRWLSR
jgi:hypothetical protein